MRCKFGDSPQRPMMMRAFHALRDSISRLAISVNIVSRHFTFWACSLVNTTKGRVFLCLQDPRGDGEREPSNSGKRTTHTSALTGSATRTRSGNGRRITSCARRLGCPVNRYSPAAERGVLAMPGIEFTAVAQLLSCRTFAEREMDLHRNRARCPFHGGDHYNLQFFPDGRCYCHVCHRCADVVQLASAVWRLPQLDAARLLNDEFRLGLSAGAPPAEQRQRRQREREQREAAEQAARAEWGAAADELREAEQAAAGFTLADADNPATWAAVARMGAALDKWHAMRAGVTG